GGGPSVSCKRGDRARAGRAAPRQRGGGEGRDVAGAQRVSETDRRGLARKPLPVCGRSTPLARAGGVAIRFGDDDKQLYLVVVHDEEQSSIWPLERDLPNGWRDGGKQGLKAECLAFIREVWVDMRPLSLRRKMDG